MHRIRRVVITLVAAAAAMFPVAAFASAPPASADPICGTPGTPPCAGPSPLTPEQHVTQYETATAPTISGGQAVLLANPLMSRPILVRCRERAALVLATGNEVGRVSRVIHRFSCTRNQR